MSIWAERRSETLHGCRSDPVTPDALFADFEAGFARRKFTAGLLVAFIDFLNALDVHAGRFASFDKFLESFPRQTSTSAAPTP
jgi:hypothetical protein